MSRAASNKKLYPRFDNAAAQSPYMFIGALAGMESSADMIQEALGAAVMDAANVTANEAARGWALPAEIYYGLGTDVSVADISEACYKHFKGNANAFKEACGQDTWGQWESLAQNAESSGLKDAINKVRAECTERDTRMIVMMDALYFAGLARDEAGANVVAWNARETKLRHDAVVKFVNDGTRFADIAAMREAARLVAEEVCAEAAAPKRKREAVDADSLRKMRRANMMTAIMDAINESVPAAEWTEEEQAFVEAGPKKMAEIVRHADVIARKRIRVARTNVEAV